MSQASEAKLALRNQERRALEKYILLYEDLELFVKELCAEGQHEFEERLQEILNNHDKD